jgi:hypothetical protein
MEGQAADANRARHDCQGRFSGWEKIAYLKLTQFARWENPLFVKF